MNQRTIHQRTFRASARAASIAAALLAGALWLTAPAEGALSPSAFHVGRLCSAPPPGYSGCLGLRLVAKRPLSLRGSRTSTPAARASRPALRQIEYTSPWEGSLSPKNLLSAYSLANVPAPATQQTLALIDAYNDPTAEHDLKVFDEQFQLPACTTANGCFTKVALHSPTTNAGWAQETATDVEVAHGVCPSCKILLVEASSNSNADLEEAEEKAVQLGASEISNSWGGSEQGITAREDASDAFNHPGIVITAAAGDDGYLDWEAEEPSERGYPDYPASSPHVVAVGGTRLSLTAGGAWKEETVWNGDGAGGGGCSTALAAPPWQQDLADWSAVGCGAHRAVADVAADADPYTGVAVYDSTPIREGEVEYRGWIPIGGTSVASPIIASTFALAGGAGTGPGGKPVEYAAQTLYENFAAHPAALHDVTSGSNGACTKGFDEQTGVSSCTLAEEDASCSGRAICLARASYDGPTGVGTPHGISAFESAGEAARIKQLEEQQTAAEKRAKEAEQAEAAEAEQRAEAERQTERKAEEALKAAEKLAEEERLQLAEAAKAAKEVAESEEKAGPAKATEPDGEPGTNVDQPTANAGAGALSGVPPQPPSMSPGASPTLVPVLSAPALTRAATAALAHRRPPAARIAFAFTLNTPARVRVTLAKQVTVRVRGRRPERWQTLPYSLTIAGARGRDSAHLSAHAALAPGRYRLTLTPAGGLARTLTFQIG